MAKETSHVLENPIRIARRRCPNAWTPIREPGGALLAVPQALSRGKLGVDLFLVFLREEAAISAPVGSGNGRPEAVIA